MKMNCSGSGSPSATGRIHPRVVARLAAVTVACFGLLQFAHNLADVDLWGNVGFVSAFPWQEGYHYRNTHSYTEPDQPWTNHEWGAEYILHYTHRWLGNTGLLALKIAIGFILLFLMDRELRRGRVSGPVRFGLLLLALSTIGYGFSTRPHLFTYLMIVSFILLLRQGRDRLLLILSPLLGVVWANLHGAFFIGVIMLVLGASAALIPAGTAKRPDFINAARRGAAALLFMAGASLNPYGLRIWRFIGASAAIIRPYLSEWAPFHPLRDAGDHSDFMALIFVIAVALVIARRRVRPLDVILTGAALLSGLLMRRNIPFFALAAALCAGDWVEFAYAEPLQRLTGRLKPMVAGVLLAGAAALCIIFTVGGHRERPLEIVIDRAAFPVDLMNALAAVELEANILWFFDWAEYAIWKLPHSRVFIDGRFCSAYSRPVIDDYLAFIYAGDGWERALTAYPTDLVIVHNGNPCVPLLQAHPDWTAVHSDPPAIVFAPAGRAADTARLIRTGLDRIGDVQPVFP